MAKLSGFNRKRIGHRNHVANIQSPPLSVDEYGQRSYASGSWTTVVSSWWCELVDTGGGEYLNGTQTKERTEKVAIGDSSAVKGVVNNKCKLTIDGDEYGIVAVRDISGDNKTIRIELKAIK